MKKFGLAIIILLIIGAAEVVTFPDKETHKDAIVNHPLVPKDVIVRGFIIDSVTGELTEIR